MPSRLARVEPARLHLWLMLVLTFGTGVADAVGYLGLDRVFTGNMTGNVVILGMGAAGGNDLPVAGPLLALLGFMAGAAAGGRALRSSAGAWSPVTAWMFAVVGLVVLALAPVVLVLDDDLDAVGMAVVATLLATAMGLQAATARVVAVKDVTTVVVTSTITGFAADSPLGSGKGGGTARRAVAVVAIVAGAAVGALLLQWHLAAGLALSGVLVLGTAFVGGWHHRLRAS